MLKWIASLLLSLIFTISLTAQSVLKKEEISESQVPQVVKENHDNNIGFPVDKWFKLIINNQPRYVAVVSQMNPSSGKTLKHHYRYNAAGKATSHTEYRGNGKGEANDFFIIYLGTSGDNPALENKLMKIQKENDLFSFEGFSFVPGNSEEFITTHRVVFEDKSGKRTIVYFDQQGKEVDMNKYPIRLLEATEADL